MHNFFYKSVPEYERFKLLFINGKSGTIFPGPIIPKSAQLQNDGSRGKHLSITPFLISKARDQNLEMVSNIFLMLSRTEGIIPALESAHAIAVLDYLKFKPTDNVVLNLSGRGDKDLNTYITKKNEFMPE